MLAYTPTDTVAAPHHQQRKNKTRSGIRCICPKCETLKSAGQIVTHAPIDGEFDDQFGMRVIHRTIYCAGCHHLVDWVERCTLDGRPTGEWLTEPKFRRSNRAIRDFLTAHPEAMEVEQI